jgi:hypothetical protein
VNGNGREEVIGLKGEAFNVTEFRGVYNNANGEHSKPCLRGERGSHHRDKGRDPGRSYERDYALWSAAVSLSPES